MRSADAPFDTFFYCYGPAAHRFLHVTHKRLYQDDQRRFASPDLHPTMLRLRDALDQVVEAWASHDFGTCRPSLRCEVELRDLPWSRAQLAIVERADGYALDGIRLYGEPDVLLSPLSEEHGEADEVCRIAPLDDEHFEELLEPKAWPDSSSEGSVQ